MIYGIPEWPSGFPYFLQFKSKFGKNEFMIWDTVSPWTCFCWLYRGSPSSATNNTNNLILVCVELSLVLLEESVCYVWVASCCAMYDNWRWKYTMILTIWLNQSNIMIKYNMNSSDPCPLRLYIYIHAKGPHKISSH